MRAVASLIFIFQLYFSLLVLAQSAVSMARDWTDMSSRTKLSTAVYVHSLEDVLAGLLISNRGLVEWSG